MRKIRLFSQKYPTIRKVIFLMCFILIFCFAFPLSFDFWKIYLLVIAYITTGLGFITMYGINRGKFVYIVSFILTGLGIITRYIFEYANIPIVGIFTQFNIISYLVVIPIFSVIAYYFCTKCLSEKN